MPDEEDWVFRYIRNRSLIPNRYLILPRIWIFDKPSDNAGFLLSPEHLP
jgi:hypothetical protein